MHDLITTIVLGIVEGATEFLPISSTGHLIIVNQWLSFDPDFTKTFDIVIQLGAILAVVWHFWARLMPFRKNEAGQWQMSRSIISLWKKVIVGVIPAIILGALFGSKIEAALFNPIVVACALIIGGIILIIAEMMKRRETVLEVKDVSYGKSFAIGVIQCLSFIPGTSRSAATIIGALFLGVARPAAVEFSFFLAIPTMVAATGYSLLKTHLALSFHEVVLLILGLVVTFLVALVAIRWVMKYIQSHTFKPFGYYRIVLGVLVLALFFFFR